MRFFFVGYSLTYRQALLSVRRRPHSLNIFSLETAWPIKVKFHMEPPWNGGTKICSNGPGHMTKMATMPIYGQNLKKSFSPEPKGRWWYAALGAQVLPSLFKWWPGDDLDLFYGKVKFEPLCFCLGKKVKQWIFFSETVVVYDIKIGRCG